MEKPRFNKFYRVFTNDTQVTEISFNDFIPVRTKPKGEPSIGQPLFPTDTYRLLPEKEMFYGYELKTYAMEMAKAGALKYIASLIVEGPGSIEKLKQYRFDHFEDLNVTLTDANIQRLKSTLNTSPHNE